MNDRSYIESHRGHTHFISDTRIRKLRDSFTAGKGDQEFLRIIRNLCDETKLGIYVILHQVSEISVADLTEVTGSSQSAVSHALADLKQIGLVDSCRCGKLVCYKLTDPKGKSSRLRVLRKFIA
jgi:DNA-binding transcriptional ArsR family regulator